MSKFFSALSDIITLAFNLAFYVSLIRFKKNNRHTKKIAYAGCAFILIIYFVCVYMINVPVAAATFLCMTIPSFAFFLALSEYKDARFIFTFCFADTIALIGASCARILSISAGEKGEVVSCLLLLAIYSALYFKSQRFFKMYHELLERVHGGWGSLMVSSILIYFMILFSAASPLPLAERPEYIASYTIMLVTIVSVYVVFVVTLSQKKQLNDLNAQLLQEKKWHNIAFKDPLTDLNNRMAYMERLNQLERNLNDYQAIYAIMVDIDNFKHVNDALGHHVGDQMLKSVAAYLKQQFPENSHEVFRIGGDEFAIIVFDSEEKALAEKIKCLNSDEAIENDTCSLSVGYSKVDFNQYNAMENAFIRADHEMYQSKADKKK